MASCSLLNLHWRDKLTQDRFEWSHFIYDCINSERWNRLCSSFAPLYWPINFKLMSWQRSLFWGWAAKKIISIIVKSQIGTNLHFSHWSYGLYRHPYCQSGCTGGISSQIPDSVHVASCQLREKQGHCTNPKWSKSPQWNLHFLSDFNSRKDEIRSEKCSHFITQYMQYMWVLKEGNLFAIFTASHNHFVCLSLYNPYVCVHICIHIHFR